MKKFVSFVLIVTTIASVVNVSFAAEASKKDIISHNKVLENEVDIIPDLPDNIQGIQYREYDDYEKDSCIPSKEQLLQIVPGMTENTDAVSKDQADTIAELYSETPTALAADMITSFNTLTAPTIQNGANEPKFSYDKFLDEYVSDYSGELTLNFEDLVLEGRNNLDLRIGRTYQTVAADLGRDNIIILPNDNGGLVHYFPIIRYSISQRTAE